MLLAKFQDHQSSGSKEEGKVLTIYGYGGHHGHVTWTIYTNFCFFFQRRLHMKFGLSFSEEKIFENG